MSQRSSLRFDRWLPWLAFLHDMVMAAIAFLLAMYLRVIDEPDPSIYWTPLKVDLPIFVGAAAVSFQLLRLYRGLWRYASFRDLMSVGYAISIAVLAFFPITFLINRFELMPRTVPLIAGFVLLALLSGPRLLYRALKDRIVARTGAIRRIPVLLIGAGDGAELFIRATAADPTYPYRVVGVLDDKSRNLVGRQIHGIRILGHADDLPAAIAKLNSQKDRPERLIITSSTAELDNTAIRRLVEAAQPFGLTIARLPNLTEFRDAVADGRLKFQPIAVEDLLGRPQVTHDLAPVMAMIAGQRVLITGAGGTIGGELTRQVAALGPARLALVEHGEFALYTIGQAIGVEYPALDVALHIGDVRDRARIAALVADERPDVVFHAAALKHLPLAELNPSECVLTNAIGTRNVADAARSAAVKTMVTISTDKAVKPSSVMGLTKRIAETYCQALDLEASGRTRYVTVRFGNVLGSTGSVVPLFERQLEAGGPLTVTHPDVERYFMTCAEAVQLVLQAAAYSMTRPQERGRIFVLDMGEPVKIVDLARQMIRLAGLEPDRDVEIVFTGLRPGEKLTETLSEEDEPLQPTAAPGIQTASPRTTGKAAIDAYIDALADAAAAGEGSTELMSLLEQGVDGDVTFSLAEQRVRKARPA